MLFQAMRNQVVLRAKPLSWGLSATLIVGIFFADPLISLGPTVGILYAIPVAFIGFWSSSKESRFVVITATVCTALLLLTLFMGSPTVLHDDFLNRVLSIVAIWGIVIASLSRKRMAQEVRSLRGLLSMCSYCRRVRDSKQQWITLEQLVSAHTEADFSHGICPECLPKHFPESIEKPVTKALLSGTVPRESTREHSHTHRHGSAGTHSAPVGDTHS
jgi:hypothetical protein